MDLIEIIGVSKRFKEKKGYFRALDDVNLKIRKGEIFGLLGPNGAGKTTLLNIILGIVLPDRGKVKIKGRDIGKEREIVERMNYVSGETRFHWVLTVKDVLKFYGVSYGISRKKLKRKIDELLCFFEIENIAYRKFDSLSTGEKMRLIFAKALLNEPEILLFDEPTLGLDPQIAVKVRGEIARINRELGTTVLLTSHYMQEVEQLCHRIAFIRKGKIVDVGKVEDLKKRKFSTYEVVVEVGEIKDADLLRRKGFEIKGKKVRIILSSQGNLGEALSFLFKNGYRVLNLEIKRPTLEDYFIKSLEDEDKMV
ncbi:ABC transporter ATP-binding protein [Candidatus Aerophobetes bacterium]|nr:ABC transporter ATP-binding protein [Candidatus Aerophobetes bacterium]